MMKKLDLTNPDLNSLGLELNNIKQVLQEASQNQASLIYLTQEGDKVGSNLSQEGSSKLRITSACTLFNTGQANLFSGGSVTHTVQSWSAL